jgi:hypothetical protein
MKLPYPIMLLFIYLGAATTINAQSRLQPYSDARWVAKINTLSWLDPETPTLQPGIEYQFKKRLSGEFTIGIPTRIYSHIRPTDSTYNKYFKLKAELKFFPGERRSFYIGPELTYISRKRSRYGEVFTGKDGKSYAYDYARLKKSIFALSMKFGFVLPNSGRWLFDTYFGAGPRFMYETVDAVNKTTQGQKDVLFWRSDREGFTTTIHVTMGLKVGYIIR